MDSIQSCIDQFDEKILAAHSQIESVLQSVNRSDDNLQQHLQTFEQSIHAIQIKADNEYEKQLQSLLREYQGHWTAWCRAVQDYVKGQDFIDQFEKSLLVVVFGNVNVGKSSIGNLIAGAVDPDTSRHYEQDVQALLKFLGKPPKFYEYDLAGSTEAHGPREKEPPLFKEGYTETTANIQYFTRQNGLTWTDSPGICSVNHANGDLAKKYVEFADLVIFVTTSSSPAKQDEIQELKKLFRKKKPVLLLVNKSDRWVKDEVDGQIVKSLEPKSETDRKKQEEYIAKELFQDNSADLMENIGAVSISTYLAMDAMRENDSEKFESSGFPRFYQQLGAICEKKAVDLKMEAPKQRLNAIIDELRGVGIQGTSRSVGIAQYQEQLHTMQEKIQEAKKAIDSTKTAVVEAVKKQSMDKIILAVQTAKRNVRDGGSVDLSEKVNRIVTETMNDVVKERLQPILSDFQSDMIKQERYLAKSAIRLAANRESYEHKEFTEKTVDRDPRGIFEHIVHLVTKKQYKETVVSERTVKEWYTNGDNSAEVMNDIQADLESTVKKYIQTTMENIKIQYFGSVESILAQIQTLLVELDSSLEKERL